MCKMLITETVEKYRVIFFNQCILAETYQVFNNIDEMDLSV